MKSEPRLTWDWSDPQHPKCTGWFLPADADDDEPKGRCVVRTQIKPKAKTGVPA